MDLKRGLTQERLKELLDYDPETGVFIRKIGLRGCKAGDIAGCECSGYLVFRVDRVLYLSHRLAFLWMEGYLPENDVDHIDRNKKNNKWANLREVSKSCNTINCPISSRNKSGITGVSWYKKSNKWIAQIQIHGEHRHLGFFISLKDAAIARWKAETKYGFPNCNSTSTAFLFIKQIERGL